MANTVKKTITTAVWIYEDPEGARRIGYRGEVVELSKEVAEAGAKAGVFDQPPAGVVTVAPVPEPVLAPNFDGVYESIAERVPGHAPGFTAADDSALTAPLRHDVQPVVVASVELEDELEAGGLMPPLKAAPKADWVDYVVAKTASTDKPVTAEEADALNKSELIELYG